MIFDFSIVEAVKITIGRETRAGGRGPQYVSRTILIEDADGGCVTIRVFSASGTADLAIEAMT